MLKEKEGGREGSSTDESLWTLLKAMAPHRLPKTQVHKGSAPGKARYAPSLHGQHNMEISLRGFCLPLSTLKSNFSKQYASMQWSQACVNQSKLRERAAHYTADNVLDPTHQNTRTQISQMHASGFKMHSHARLMSSDQSAPQQCARDVVLHDVQSCLKPQSKHSHERLVSSGHQDAAPLGGGMNKNKHQ